MSDPSSNPIVNACNWFALVEAGMNPEAAKRFQKQWDDKCAEVAGLRVPLALTEQEQHCVDHMRYQAVRATPANPDCSFDFEFVEQVLRLIERLSVTAVAAERERCAQVVETALRADFKAKCGRERDMSEAEVFLAAAIRSIRT